MNKPLEITLRAFDPTHSDYNCPPGELRPGNYSTNPDSTIGPGFAARPLLPVAGQAVCRHADRLITFRSGTLYYTPLPHSFLEGTVGLRPADAASHPDGHCGSRVECSAVLPPSPGPQATPFATAAEAPTCHASHGDTLVLVHDGALHYYHWIGQGYDHRDLLPPLPILEFGLKQAAMITASPRVKFDASLLPPAGSRDPGSTHPSADHPNETLTPGTSSSSSGAQGTALTSCFTDALASEAYSRGLFAMPFLLRYALRDRRGHYLVVSPPQLMLPTVLPPRLAVTETAVDADTDTATARIDMTANRLFALCCRCATLPAVPQEWHDEVAAIDIFVTPQFLTYDPDSPRGFICAYGDIVRSADSGAPNRGRDHAATPTECFDGRYSIDGTAFTDHRLTEEALHTDSWWVEPNPRLCADIASATDFYRVASLDPDTLSSLDSRLSSLDLSIDNTSPDALCACRRLDPAETMAVNPVPDALFCLNDHILAAGGTELPPRPCLIEGTVGLRPADASSNASVNAAMEGIVGFRPADETVTLTIFSREGREITATDLTCTTLLPIEENFPRFIHHPDPLAFMMQISCGDVHYRLPLKPHDTLGGVYWFGGLDAHHIPEPTSEPITLQSPLLLNRPRLCHNVLSISEKDCPHIFRPTARVTVGHGRIAALHSALKAPSNALPGRFPIYAFTTEGIYFLMTNDELQITNAVKITNYELQITNSASIAEISRSIAPFPGGIAYISGNCVATLSGSKVNVISRWAGFKPADTPFAPTRRPEAYGPLQAGHPDDLCGSRVECSAVLPPSSGRPRRLLPALAWLPSLRALAVSNNFLYFPDTESFTWHCPDFLYAADGLLQLDSDTIGTLTPCIPGQLITRPIRIDQPLTGVLVYGAPYGLRGIAVYGANHPHPSRWTPIGTSRTHRLDILSKSRWKYIKVVITNYK